jgi:hypothetical protein
MPRRSKVSANEELAALREQYAAEHGRVRGLEVALERAKQEAEEASRAVTDGYAAEDEKAVAEAREREHQAAETVSELEGQLAGAVVRAERAGRAVDEFQTERARDLLSEAEAAARETTLNLRRAAEDTARFWRQYKQDRNAILQLVNRLEPGAGQVNGPPSNCAWKAQLADLERALRLGEELEPPLPRWSGRAWRRQEDATARRLHEERAARKPRSRLIA